VTKRKSSDKFDPANVWDVITCTPDGGTIWKNYGVGQARRIVVTHGDENPQEVAAREDEAQQ
jgi:hypothetical protein